MFFQTTYLESIKKNTNFKDQIILIKILRIIQQIKLIKYINKDT